MTEVKLKRAKAIERDQVGGYLVSIGKLEILSPSEERELFALVVAMRERGAAVSPDSGDNRILREGMKARDEIYTRNLKLVVHVAKKYTERGMDFADIIQYGNIGLDRAIAKFDPSKGYKFSTYAYWWIRQAITREMDDKNRMIRLPIHMIEKLNKIKKVQKEILKTGNKPTLPLLSERLKMKQEDIRELLSYLPRTVSLDRKIGDDEKSSLLDFIPDSGSSPIETAQRNERAEDLDRLLGVLSDIERQVIELRYGLGSGEPLILKEIGRRLELSGERVRQIEEMAMKKLKSSKIKTIVENNR